MTLPRAVALAHGVDSDTAAWHVRHARTHGARRCLCLWPRAVAFALAVDSDGMRMRLTVTVSLSDKVPGTLCGSVTARAVCVA